jgi:ParB family chromosome partitioning protein
MGDVGDETAEADSGRKPRRAPIENLRANPRNPRRAFTEPELNELTDSIRERGIIQPIVVRAVQGQSDNFEIIAGERRWRAAQRAGLHEVPVAVVEATDAQALEFAIIENVQRADLNAIEEAAGYLALMEEFSHSQDALAQIVGKSRPHVANTLRLLKLSEPVKALVASGQLSAGHARILIGQPNALELANDIIKRGLNVRQVEAAMRKDGGAQARDLRNQAKGHTRGAKDADTRALERRLSDALGLEVTVDHRGQGGTLHIKYRDLDQLDGVLRKLGG